MDSRRFERSAWKMSERTTAKGRENGKAESGFFSERTKFGKHEHNSTRAFGTFGGQKYRKGYPSITVPTKSFPSK